MQHLQVVSTGGLLLKRARSAPSFPSCKFFSPGPMAPEIPGTHQKVLEPKLGQFVSRTASLSPSSVPSYQESHSGEQRGCIQYPEAPSTRKGRGDDTEGVACPSRASVAFRFPHVLLLSRLSLTYNDCTKSSQGNSTEMLCSDSVRPVRNKKFHRLWIKP